MKSQKEINKYSDKELIRKIAEVGSKEIESTAELLLHLIEIDSRKLYRKQGYSSRLPAKLGTRLVLLLSLRG